MSKEITRPTKDLRVDLRLCNVGDLPYDINGIASYWSPLSFQDDYLQTGRLDSVVDLFSCQGAGFKLRSANGKFQQEELLIIHRPTNFLRQYKIIRHVFFFCFLPV